jgi:hypothetical protein
MLEAAWRGWRRVARKIGAVQSRIVLAVFYFVLLAPFAVALRRTDPLRLRATPSWPWLPDGEPGAAQRSIGRQF